MLVHQAFRFALDPTPAQGRGLRSHCGAARYAFNWGLALVKGRLDERSQGAEVEVPSSLPALRLEWNQAKAEVAPWWEENSKEAYNSGLDGLARALANFQAARKGKRKGRSGFPRFRKRGGRRESCRFTTGAIKVLAGGRHVQLPRLGVLKTHEPTGKLLALLESGRARLLSATVSLEADRWFVSFGCEVEREQGRPKQPDSVIGVDVGLHHLAVLSTGEVVANPRPLQRSLDKLRRTGRQLSRCQPGSRRRQRAKRTLGRLHARVRNQRRDCLHKLTSSLVAEHGTVVVETLNVAGMTRNRRLARSLADAGLAEIRRVLEYKARWGGCRLLEADPFFPSSKTCSECGWVRAKLSLSERRFDCDACGVSLDRDHNAARNLARLVEHVAWSVPGDVNRPPRGCKTRPGRANPDEAGSQQPDGRQTGTAAEQSAAAQVSADDRLSLE